MSGLGQIEAHADALVVATNGHAEFFHHTGEEPQQIVAEILKLDPDIVLMDENLHGNVRGTSLTRDLARTGFKGKIVGFSSDPSLARAFEQAGAVGMLRKSAFRIEENLQKLSALVAAPAGPT